MRVEWRPNMAIAKDVKTFCFRCGRVGVVHEWHAGPYCPECNIPAGSKTPPAIRGHWCDGLRTLQEGIHAGTPRLTDSGTLISIGDEYDDEENKTPILFCPMCGIKL
jgi:hypothetical protein